jgi:hypothetical protein
MFGFRRQPRTVAEAVTEVLARLDEPARQAIQETAEADLIQFHDDLGMTIRNELGLWSTCWPRAGRTTRTLPPSSSSGASGSGCAAE